MSKNILITGGTGFIGRHLCAEMLAEGWRVEVLTRDAAAARKMLPDAAHAIESVSESNAPEVIVNLAGENLASGRWTAARKREMRDSRVRVTEQINEYIAGADARPRVLISGSAVGYYGARGSDTVTESQPPGDEFQSDLCAAWEAEARRAEDYGVRVCRIRTGVVLGPDGGALASMITPFKLGLGGQFGSGRQYMPWVHIRDEIRAIRFLMENEQCEGAYNCTAPEPATNREFSETLAQVLKRPSFFWVPGTALKLGMGEMARLLLTGQRALPQRLIDAGFEFKHGQLEPALRNLLAKR